MNKQIIVGGVILLLGMIFLLTQNPGAVSLVSDKDIVGGNEALPIILLFFVGLGIFAFAMGAVLGPQKTRAKQ